MRRMILSVLAAGILPASALAQSMPPGVPSPMPDPQFINGIVTTLQQQRNNALDQVAQAQAQNALLQSQLAAAQKQIADLKAASAPKEELAK